MASVHDECVPGANVISNTMHCSLVSDVGGKSQAGDIAICSLYSIFRSRKRRTGAPDEDDSTGARNSECYCGLAANATSLSDVIYQMCCILGIVWDKTHSTSNDYSLPFVAKFIPLR